ncbi:PIG-L family deacetylase [Candidatus Woesearchaeota archaeon]|nr:PIG-L family deacetylase [Candidatus Woesearchaeota archaeon]
MVVKRVIKEFSPHKKDSIIVFGAHSDDFVIGAGGTIANYVKEGKKVISIVFSYGEKSHPWLKPEVIKRTRSREAFDAGNIMNCRMYMFNLEELKFYESYKQKNIEPELLKLMEHERPSKVFTHSQEDPHPDHQAANRITLELWKKLTFTPKPEVYTYSVWNPVSFHTIYPALYINITKSFSAKLKALKAFRSQQIQIAYPVLLLMFRAIKDGFKIGALFGEKFFRIK